MNVPSPRSLAAGVALALALTGCRTVGPDFIPPEPDAPTAFHHAPSPANAHPPLPSIEAWWTIFPDPALAALQTAALRHSPTLAATVARVDEARAARGIVRSERSVNTSLDASAQIAGESPERLYPSPAGEFRARTRGDLHRLSMGAGYELDLWGRVRRLIESADASVDAAEADLAAVRLALTLEVAATWYQALAITAEQEVVARTAVLQRDEATLRRNRIEAGLSSEFDLVRNQRELAQTEAELAVVSASRDRTLAALSTLTGRPVSELIEAIASRTTLPENPPVIPAGLPSSTLARRPDVHAAVARLHARTAEVGVAEAAYFPTIRLTGAAGFESVELSSLLERPSQFWNVGPAVSLPLFDGGRRDARLASAHARVEIAAADFRAAVLGALRDVETALIDLRLRREQGDAQSRALAASRESVALARARQGQGLTSYLEVIDAERSALVAERALARNRAETHLATVRLIGALGGGWENP